MSITVPLEGFGGGGGTALNFKVVPGLTQPGAATENTIWVKTENITGWYFAAEQPENMAEWEVWFPTGTSSSVEFNALKKNAVQVYPVSAKQMVDGALVDVEAKSYQGSQWVDWFVYLLKGVDKYTDITGGWTTDGFAFGSLGFAGSSYSDDGVIINARSGINCGVATANQIDFSGYKKIRILLETKISQAQVRFSTTNNCGNSYAGFVAMYTVPLDSSGFGEVDISVSTKCHLYVIPDGFASGTVLLQEVCVV